MKGTTRLCACGCKQVLRSLGRRGRTRFIVGHKSQSTKPRWRVDPVTGCWEWLLSKDTCGYGHTWENGKLRSAHIVNYEKKYGPVPKGKELDHVVCDNRGCCTPDHVRPVTHTANIRRGKNTKLTLSQIREMRRLARVGCTQAFLAKTYKVRSCHVSSIVNGLNWQERQL